MNKKVVLITGSAKGIGAEVAREFAKTGYQLILHYFTSVDRVIKLKEELELKYSTQVFLIQANLSNEIEINYMIKEIINKFSKIDVLVNNAALSMDCDVLEKTKEEFVKVLEVNLIAPFLLIKKLSTALAGGTVINISSTDADDTGSSINIDYCASKAGLNSLTKTLSLAYQNIRICAIAPNWVKTEAVLEMEPTYLESELKRIGQKNLIEPNIVAKKIIEIVEDTKIPSGSIERIEG